MYTPSHFCVHDESQMQALIRRFPLGALVCMTEQGLDANHLPFELLENTAANGGTQLIAHVARANPLWQQISNGDRVLVIFRAEDAYISPNWYPSKARDHKAVPTWNYQAVHLTGRLTLLDDTDSTLAVLSELSRIHEADQPRPWQLADAPPDYIQAMCKALKCFEFTIESVEAAYKLSQNQSAENRSGVVNGLQAQGSAAAEKMAEKVQRFAPDS